MMIEEMFEEEKKEIDEKRAKQRAYNSASEERTSLHGCIVEDIMSEEEELKTRNADVMEREWLRGTEASVETTKETGEEKVRSWMQEVLAK